MPIFAVSRGADLIGNAGAVGGTGLALIEGLVAIALVVQLQTEVARVYTSQTAVQLGYGSWTRTAFQSIDVGNCGDSDGRSEGQN